MNEIWSWAWLFGLCEQGMALPALYTLVGRWAPPDDRVKMTLMLHGGTALGGFKAYFTGTNVMTELGKKKPSVGCKTLAT